MYEHDLRYSIPHLSMLKDLHVRPLDALELANCYEYAVKRMKSLELISTGGHKVLLIPRDEHELARFDESRSQATDVLSEIWPGLETSMRGRAQGAGAPILMKYTWTRTLHGRSVHEGNCPQWKT